MSIENRSYHRDKNHEVGQRIKEIRDKNNLSKAE